MVSMEFFKRPFFWGEQECHSVSMGPFRSSKAWIEARLLVIEQECHCTITRFSKADLVDGYNRGLVHVARETLRIIGRLKCHVLNELFPSSKEDEAERSMLCHCDLSMSNIMVDKAGTLLGVVDWECVSALPLWKACDYPLFLRAIPLKEKPDRAEYVDRDGKYSDQRYWEDVLRYEATLLCAYFLDEMRRLEPGWVEVFEASERRREFNITLQYCDNGEVYQEKINLWIDHFFRKGSSSDAITPLAQDDLGQAHRSDPCKVPLLSAIPEPIEVGMPNEAGMCHTPQPAHEPPATHNGRGC